MPSLKAMAKEVKNKKSAAPKKEFQKVSPPTLSTEFVQESEEEDDERPGKYLSSDDKESLPESLAADTSKVNGKVALAAVDSSSETGSESESVEGTDSEDDEDEEEEGLNKGTKNISIVTERTGPQPPNVKITRTVSFKGPAPYKPPHGFEITSIDPTPKLSQIFQKSSLEGKQIWYITASASVPIASIKEMSLAKVKEGKKVVSHNGNDYGFVEDTSEDNTFTKLMIPNSSDDGYRAVREPIDKILHLQQLVKLPAVYDQNMLEAATPNAARPTVPAKKPIRQQPAGLKMRFHPIGFGNGKAGTIGSSSSSADENGTGNGSDDEMEDATPQFRKPALLSTSDSADEDLSSSSNVEMAEAPLLSSKIGPKSKSRKSTAKGSAKTIDRPLKRKHSEGVDTKTNHSSSSSKSSIDDKQLRKIKKKQKTSPTDSQSVSTEAQKTKSKSDNVLPSSTSISQSATGNAPILPSFPSR